MSNIVFRPVRGKENSILAMELSEGCVYFAVDTGKIYLDTATERLLMGSAAGASIFYGSHEKPEAEDTGYYHIPIETVIDTPKVGDLILNSDGGFYKVEAMGEDSYICSLLSVSGTGGGGPAGDRETKPSITLSIGNTSLINGQPAYFHIKASSAFEADGVTPVDTTLNVIISLGTRITDTTVKNYYTTTLTYKTADAGYLDKYGVGPGYIDDDIEFGTYLKESASSVLSVYVQGANHDKSSYTRTVDVTTSSLKLNQLSSYTPANRYSVNGFTLSCNVIGAVNKIVKCYYDDELLETKSYPYTSANVNPNFTIPAGEYDRDGLPVPKTATHGYHTIEIQLCQDLGGGVEGLYVEPLRYEIAVVKDDPEAPPVIWLGDYKAEYYTYDTIQIPFLVWDPANTTVAKVHLYKNRIELESSPRDITSFTAYNQWEIADADFNQLNSYQISCGETDGRRVEREIRFNVVADPNRDMTVETGNLSLNFNATGRSNSESAAKRQIWNYMLDDVKKSATFTDFNWFNNGWIMDNEINTSCLRISNGAKFSIPYKVMTFASGSSDQQSHTVELQFKIRNIQQYNNLITNITRYKGDGEWYANFQAQKDTGYSNYDAYLQATLTPEQYENLEFLKVEKVIQIENAVGGLYDYNPATGTVTGFCIGTQDAFFSNGTDTVNVNFVENELINLSFVYQHSLKQLYIYINGVITGVIKSSIEDGKTFSILSSNFVFNSNHCDIDLYRLRIYQTDLNVNQIVKNFAVDRKNVTVFDQNALAEENITLKEYQLSYDNMIKYNEEHPNNPLMPYIIFDTGDINSRLPYSKKDTKKISIEFVNTPLERAYANGELEALARADGLLSANETDGNKIVEAVKLYYKHHCPSFTSSMKSDDKVDFSVQGTSSEFYPRRNFKVKSKVKGDFNWEADETLEEGGSYTEDSSYNLFMNRGPYAEAFIQDQADLAADPKKLGYEQTRLSDGWYMNNYTNATNKWTMKVDYMESSGSYNAGFASLVGNAYTKHPLQDYLDVLGGTSKLQPVVDTSTVDTKGMRWQDYRTSVLGFPVMAFWKRGSGDDTTYTFIGYYRMLYDKGSDEVYGFKPNKKVTHKLFPKGKTDDEGNPTYKSLRDIAECWEFSNNARGFCSFRDPWNRVELSFKAPKGVPNEYTAAGAPVVANSFEYRYNTQEDYIDMLYDFDAASQDDLNEAAKELGLPDDAIIAGERETGADALLTVYKNWEQVAKWLWSTNLDAVESQGVYTKVPVGDVEYTTDGSFFIINNEGSYEASTSEFNENETYYRLNSETNAYEVVYATTAEYLYESGKFYYLVDDDTYAIANDENYDGSIDYYTFTDSDISELNNRFDLLVKPVDITKDTFDTSIQYYTWHGTDYDVNDESRCVVVKKGSPTGAVQAVINPTEEEWSAGLYYVAGPVEYAGKTYTHDTKEYRAAKFVNEFEDHFDPEYVATYFVMTEVMECYDSRGKNCMMASWGPQKEGGNYIWYPLFYDIDTQLGINNTGIPSFEYNVDATEAGNFSTSDSLLWNNFFKFFKNTWMIPKYQNLRGFDSSKFDQLYESDGTTKKSPLQSVDYIEKWYNFNPSVTHNIACRGVKPLIATNLDMYFKYITITNAKAKEQGVAHLDSNGNYADPDIGTYFYALQGDRSQSRRQFVTNRLEYIDSWLVQGNYARGGANRIWGRISANNRSDLDTTGQIVDVHSDKWTERDGKPYWVDEEFGTKSHEFDAEYWLELKPIRSSYVTAGDDSENYPSQKYDGIHKMRFKLSELENGIRTSNNYPEQLLYIYGTNQMSDFGDLSKMYWTEFKIEGNADRLTRLKLGHDGTTNDYENDNATVKTENLKWYNKKLNNITLPKLPLLKEANFCNIGLMTPTALNFEASEKLKNFRATGSSNITSIKFAQGVALDTLYLPSTLTTLSLVQANLLTDLIMPGEYATPTKDPVTGDLVAKEGLYLEGFFDEGNSSALNAIDFNGGSLGYNSFTILKRLWEKNKGIGGSAKISMTNVNWCPYEQLTEGEIYDATQTYYIDDGHYGFATYNMTNERQFNADILSGLLYKDAGHGGRNEDNTFSDLVLSINDEAITMLKELQTNDNFKNSSGLNHPELSGFIYINNDTAINEEEIVELQGYYPDLIFFFKTVTKAYSAKFVIFNEDDYSVKYVKWQDGSTSPSVQKIQTYNDSVYFASPFGLYKPEKTHYDFKGWSLDNRHPYDAHGNLLEDCIIDLNEGTEKWNEQKLEEGKYDYVYYAIFEIHKYNLNFYNDNGTVLEDTVQVPYGEVARAPEMMPSKDDSDLGLYESYDFQGYSLSMNGKLIDLSTITVSSDEDFYASFKLIKDIREVIHEDWFAYKGITYNENSSSGVQTGYTTTGWLVWPKKPLKGKITVPRTYQNKPVIALADFNTCQVTHVFVAKGSVPSSITWIQSNAFTGVSTLKYFEFENTNIRNVGMEAFMGCNLDADLFNIKDIPLVHVDQYGFNGGITSTHKATILLPSSLTFIGILGFSYLNCLGGLDLEIGSEMNPSKLNLALGSTGDGYEKFNQNEATPLDTVTFYSELYDSESDNIGGGEPHSVIDCFGQYYNSISVS